MIPLTAFFIRLMRAQREAGRQVHSGDRSCKYELRLRPLHYGSDCKIDERKMIKGHLARAAIRTWPFPRGAGRIIDMCFAGLMLPEQRVVIQTTDGFDMVVNPNELIGRHLFLSGEFDRSIVEVLLAFAMPGDTLLDIGANVGYISACFLKNVADSRVVAAEPQPAVAEMLAANLAPFGERAHLYPFAIASEDGISHFVINPANLGKGHLVLNGESSSVQVETKSGDSLFRETKIISLNLVKIDVEGAEEQVLDSCMPHFSRTNPRCILFEDNGLDLSPSSKIQRMFADLGYAIFGIKKMLTKIQLEPVSSRTNFRDYIALSMTQKMPGAARSRFKLDRLFKQESKIT
jgi:FkbM family methyltransferase